MVHVVLHVRPGELSQGLLLDGPLRRDKVTLQGLRILTLHSFEVGNIEEQPRVFVLDFALDFRKRSYPELLLIVDFKGLAVAAQVDRGDNVPKVFELLIEADRH